MSKDHMTFWSGLCQRGGAKFLLLQICKRGTKRSIINTKKILVNTPVIGVPHIISTARKEKAGSRLVFSQIEPN